MTKRPEDFFYDGLQEMVKEAQPPQVVEEPAVAAAPKRLSSKSLFSHPEAHPVVLDFALLKTFQFDWFHWLPETLFSEIEKSFGGSLAEVNRLKILAVQTLHVTDQFWEHWEIFEKTVIALNGIVPRTDVLQPPDLPLLYAGVDMANSVRDEEFGEQVSRYAAAVFLHENVHYAPDPCEFAQPYITQATYCCKDCDKCGSAIPPFDGLCTSCAGYFSDEKPLNFKPDPEAVKKGLGKNLTFGVTYDMEPTKKRFEALNAMSGDLSPHVNMERAEDIQAAKLITAMDFKNHRAQQLKEQLEALKGWMEMA